VFNQQVADRVLNALRLGSPFSKAAAYAGIDGSTLTVWRRRADAAIARTGKPTAHEQRLIDFFKLVDVEVAAAVVRAQAVIFGLMNDPDVDPRIRAQNAQWYLAHRHTDEYSIRTEVTGKDGERLADPDDVFARLAELVAGDVIEKRS
jgi:hypothetical protein